MGIVRGIGRHRMTGGGFAVRPSLGPRSPNGGRGPVGEVHSRAPAGRSAETASLPEGMVSTAFSKPVAMPANTGIVSDAPQAQIMLAREMMDNDSIAGSVVETLSVIPFGRFSLSGMPDKEHLEPYERSLDHMRTQTLMPLLARTYMADGAFLGSGVFDSGRRCWNAMILQDLLHAEIHPVPWFGATPVIDVNLTSDMVAAVRSTDPRMARYRRFLTEDLQDGAQRLQPENTFYIPRIQTAHQVRGQSMFRRIMILYVLEKALARGTVEMAYRRQRPIMHIQIGDENWDATVGEMQDVARLFQNADLDPYGATIVTRPGVQPQEVGGLGEAWKWTDIIDSLTSAKLKGLGLPDGLLGGDVALDSVSATLTVFINMTRQLRDYLTRMFMYEKVFPYLAIANGHHRDHVGAFEAHGATDPRLARFLEEERGQNYRSVAADFDHVDMSQYLMPTIQWHNSMRPEGDQQYMQLLQELNQAGVPVPLRLMASAGGIDIHEILNGARDEMQLQSRVAELQGGINEIKQAAMPQGGEGDDQGQQGQYAAELAGLHAIGHVPRARGLANRQFRERDLPSTNINGHRYVTTPRERKRMMEAENRIIAKAADRVARRENRLRRTQVIRHGAPGLAPF